MHTYTISTVHTYIHDWESDNPGDSFIYSVITVLVGFSRCVRACFLFCCPSEFVHVCLCDDLFSVFGSVKFSINLAYATLGEQITLANDKDEELLTNRN